MPFASKKQERWMFANRPDLARKWKDEEKRKETKKPKKRRKSDAK